ncbi:MAG: hypothetical protein WBL68_10995 [Nitrososphaeraceae archaeon]|jgi:hypothetical protein
MSDNKDSNKYEDMYVIVKQVKVVGSKEIFELQFVDGNGNSEFSSSNEDYRELFKMLLSKYVPLCDIGRKEFQYRIPQVPISSDEMKSVAQELKGDLERFARDPTNDPNLRRIKQLIYDVIQDIENQLKADKGA